MPGETKTLEGICRQIDQFPEKPCSELLDQMGMGDSELYQEYASFVSSYRNLLTEYDRKKEESAPKEPQDEIGDVTVGAFLGGAASCILGYIVYQASKSVEATTAALAFGTLVLAPLGAFIPASINQQKRMEWRLYQQDRENNPEKYELLEKQLEADFEYAKKHLIVTSSLACEGLNRLSEYGQ